MDRSKHPFAVSAPLAEGPPEYHLKRPSGAPSRTLSPPLAYSSSALVMSRDAVQNNSKLFPMFKQNLTDPRTYFSTAEKLAAWLGRDKAYYPSARPWIVEFVETAKRTIASLGGGNFSQDFDHISKCNDSPYLQPYVNLVKTLANFRYLFVEADLLARIDALISTITPHGGMQSVSAPASSSSQVAPSAHILPSQSNMSPVSPTASMSYPSPVIPQASSSGFSYPRPAPSVAIPGFTAPPPVFAAADRNSPLFRAPGPFPAVANVKREDTMAVSSSIAAQAQPPVVTKWSAAAVEGWRAPPPRLNIQVVGTSASSKPESSTSLQRLTELSGSGSPASISAQGKKEKKKKKKVGVTLDFLEADLDWYMEQKKQETKGDHADRELDDDKLAMSKEATEDGERKDAEAAQAQSESQQQAEHQSVQPIPESPEESQGHKDGVASNNSDVPVLPPVNHSLACPAPDKARQDEHSSQRATPTMSTQQPLAQDVDVVESSTNTVSVDASIAAASSYNAEPQQLSEPAESKSNQQTASDGANSDINDKGQAAREREAVSSAIKSGLTDWSTGWIPADVSYSETIGMQVDGERFNSNPNNNELQTAPQREIASSAASSSFTHWPMGWIPAAISPSELAARQLEISMRRMTVDISAPMALTALSATAPVSAILASPVVSTSSLSTPSPGQGLSSLSFSAPPVTAPSPLTPAKPSSTASPRVLSSRSPFDNMTREQRTSQRTVPELRIQPVRPKISASPTSLAPAVSSGSSSLPAPDVEMSATQPPCTTSTTTITLAMTEAAPTGSAVSSESIVPQAMTSLPATTSTQTTTLPQAVTSSQTITSTQLSTLPQALTSPQPTTVSTDFMTPESPQEVMKPVAANPPTPLTEPPLSDVISPPAIAQKPKSKIEAKEGPPGITELTPTLAAGSSPALEASEQLEASVTIVQLSSTVAEAEAEATSHMVHAEESRGPPGVKTLKDVASMSVESWSPGASPERKASAGADALTHKGLSAFAEIGGEQERKKRKSLSGAEGRSTNKSTRKKRKTLKGAAVETRPAEEAADEKVAEGDEEEEDMDVSASVSAPAESVSAPALGPSDTNEDEAQVATASEATDDADRPLASTSVSVEITQSLTTSPAQNDDHTPEQIQRVMPPSPTRSINSLMTTAVVDIQPGSVLRIRAEDDMDVDGEGEQRTGGVLGTPRRSSEDTEKSRPADETVTPAPSQQSASVQEIQTAGNNEFPLSPGAQGVSQPEAVPHDHPPGTILHTSINNNGGVTFQAHNYTIDSFANGDFVYPHRLTTEEGEIVSPSPHMRRRQLDDDNITANAHQERELGELTPIMSVKGLVSTTMPASASASTSTSASTATTSIATTSTPEIPMSWEVKVARARGIPITNPPPPPDYDAVHFASESMVILGFDRGGASWREHLAWDFDISAEEKQALELWADRYKTPDADVSSAKCVSLSCYKYSRCLNKLEAFYLRPDKWDWNMHPWVELNDGDDYKKIGIWSFVVTEDQLLDISARVRVGKNTIKVNYPYGNPLDWVYILRLHDPTAPQLDELRGRRNSELQWRKALDDFKNFKKPTLKWPPGIVPVRPRERIQSQTQNQAENRNE